MLKLIFLEFHRNPIRKYLLHIFIIAACLLGLTYLFAYIPHKDSQIAIEMAIVNAIAPIFSNYRSIASLTCILSMVCFSVFSSMLFNQFVINDFTGKRLYLLLSYPIKKSTMYMAKVVTVVFVSIISMLLCNAIVFSIFYSAENAFKMVTNDLVSLAVIYDTVKLSALFSVFSTSIGLISMRIGLAKKSPQISLITSFVLSAAFSNLLGVSLLVNLNTAFISFMIFTIVLSVIGVALTIGLTHKVNEMEEE